jgi:hypothetical protein
MVISSLSPFERTAILNRIAEIDAELDGLPCAAMPITEQAQRAVALERELIELSGELHAGAHALPAASITR